MFDVGADDVLLELVVRPGTCASKCPLIELGGGYLIGLRYAGGQVTGAFSNFSDPADQASAAIAASAPHVVDVRRTSATTAQLRTDGVATPITLSRAYAFAGNPELEVGFDSVDGSYLDGDVAEIVVARAPSDGDASSSSPT